jgi:hypothetical protein
VNVFDRVRVEPPYVWAYVARALPRELVVTSEARVVSEAEAAEEFVEKAKNRRAAAFPGAIWKAFVDAGVVPTPSETVHHWSIVITDVVFETIFP